MSIIYVASIGSTGANKKYYWRDAKNRFNYSESVIFCGRNMVDNVSRFLDKNANLVIIENSFYGMEGYRNAVEDIITQVMDIIKCYDKKGKMIDEIVINTAGGTEKMSCIIKDAVPILKKLFPYVTHVWGSTCGYESRYTVKKDIDLDSIYDKINAKYVTGIELEQKLDEPTITITEKQTTTEIIEKVVEKSNKKINHNIVKKDISLWQEIKNILKKLVKE